MPSTWLSEARLRISAHRKLAETLITTAPEQKLAESIAMLQAL
jgi:hypothetical protein